MKHILIDMFLLAFFKIFKIDIVLVNYQGYFWLFRYIIEVKSVLSSTES
uniref:Uncharacterized protein n=1 Tax=Bartonella rochalimae ATCC BAA-1498 TaxID=685782 RepID=E6YMU8_9HYPH|nr:hypothetical protein BARRO_80050 [Bartonella rochalimae ATCC BAA-1498]